MQYAAPTGLLSSSGRKHLQCINILYVLLQVYFEVV
jgi:hypothetical protein